MKKIFAILTMAIAGAAFAQETSPEPSSEAPAVEASAAPAATESQATAPGGKSGAVLPSDPTEIRQAAGEGPNDIPQPKQRPFYNLNSYGFGVTVWHNWEDSKENPKRDWDQGFNLHYGRIWEMGAYGAITLMNTTEFSLGDHWQWSEISRIGGRVYFADAVFAPFLGGGIGLGFQLDGHYDDFDEKFAIGFAFGAEAGVTIFRTSSVQLEIGCSYDSVLDYLDWDRRFGSFNFYIAINH